MNQIFLFAKKNKKLIILISVLVLIFGVLIFHLNTNKESFFNPTQGPTPTAFQDPDDNDEPTYRPIYEFPSVVFTQLSSAILIVVLQS